MASGSLTSGIILLATLLVAVNAHNWAFGKCPRMTSVNNLAVEKFLGVWYVIEQFDTGSRCLLLNYTRVSETQLRVTKVRQFQLLDRVGIDHTNSYSGTLDMPFGHDLGRLRVKWPLNLAGKGDYVIFDTDYTTYAGIYECQPITTLMHRKSAAILSRTPTLAPEFVNRIKRLLISNGVDTHDFDVIKHEGCRTRVEADFNVHVDSDTFRNVMKGTRTGLEEVATTLVKGISDLATAVTRAGQESLSTIQNTAQSAFSDLAPQPGPSKPDVATKANPAAENVDPGLEEGVQEGFTVAVERAEGGADETAQGAGGATSRGATGFAIERVETGTPSTTSTNSMNFPRGIAATILARRRSRIPETTRQTSSPQTTRQISTIRTTKQTVPDTTTTRASSTSPQTTSSTTTTTTTTTAATTTTTEAVNNANDIIRNSNDIDSIINNIDEEANNIDGGDSNSNAGGRNTNRIDEKTKKKNLDENYYSITNIDGVIPVDEVIPIVEVIPLEDVIPVDEIVRTLVSVDKKKKK